MKEDKKSNKKRKFNLYNLAIAICIILIILCAIIIISPDWNAIGEKFSSIGSSIQKNFEKKAQEKETKENKHKISEEDAKKKAVAKFKELGEDTNEESIKIIKIERNGKESYYISSKNNTMEILIDSGEIIRINSVVVSK